MYKIYIFSILGLLAGTLKAQYLHTPSDIQQIIEKSSIAYQLNASYQTKAAEKRSILETGWVAIPTPDSVRLIAPVLVTEEVVSKYQKKGNNFYEKGKFIKAAAAYEQMLDSGSTNYKLMKRLAESYQKGEAYESAAKWYQEIVDNNFVDYEAHHQLAECYLKMGESEKAVDHITLAHLLNRNHPLILERVKGIYLADKRSFWEYDFQPTFSIQENDAQKNVIIAYDGKPWEAYASCKALWQYEPGYKEKMKEKLSALPLKEIEEKECLLNALISYGQLEPLEQQKYPALKALGKATVERRVNDFIRYEIQAKEDPLSISRLPRAELLELADYVKILRSL